MRTNTFVIAVLVMWSTNRMDTMVTHSGDEIVRSIITSHTHVYTVPGHPTVTNTVAVATNSIHLRQVWVPVATNVSYVGTNWMLHGFPPVPMDR